MNETIGDFISLNRLMQGKSLGQVAREADISVSTLSRMESGETDPTLETFVRVLRALDFQCTLNANGIGAKEQDIFELVETKEQNNV